MKMKKLLLTAVLYAGGTALSAQTPAELKSWLPAVDGWTIEEQVEVFTPDNLFDRINGAAPLFLENNFREMTSLEYKRGDDYITIQAYRHATPEDTFGMYASERSPDLAFYPFGGEAQGDEANVFFFAGNIYVKMWGSAPDDISGTLLTIAEGLAGKIDPAPGYPKEVLAFPVGNKVPHTETYITSNYIGHEFLKRVFTTDYTVDGKSFQAFIIVADDKAGAEDTLKKYFAFSRQPEAFDEGLLTIADRYNGDIPVLWQGRYIVGLFAPNGDAMPEVEAFLKGIAAKL